MDTTITLNSEELSALSSCAWLELIHLKSVQYEYEGDEFEDDLAKTSEVQFNKLFSAYLKLQQFPSKKSEDMALHHIEQCAKEQLERERERDKKLHG